MRVGILTFLRTASAGAAPEANTNNAVRWELYGAGR